MVSWRRIGWALLLPFTTIACCFFAVVAWFCYGFSSAAREGYFTRSAMLFERCGGACVGIARWAGRRISVATARRS